MVIKENESINALVHKTNMLLKIGIQDSLRQFDITPDQWMTLRTLYYKNGCLNQKELADVRLKEPAAMMRLLILLEKKKYIDRRRASDDKREYIVFITEEGKQLFEKTLPFVSKVEKIVDTRLSNEERHTLLMLLEKLSSALPFSK